MSGNIDVDSEPSKGSRFFFTITVGKTDRNYKRFEIIQNQLSCLKDMRVLVADKYSSTVTTVRQLLPGITVDGVCPVDDRLIQEPPAANINHYSVIIVGLFLTYDSEFEKWINKVKDRLQGTRCVIVMHYPRGALSDMLLSNIASDKELLTPSTPPDIYHDDNGYWGERQPDHQQFQTFSNIDPVSTIMQVAGLDLKDNSSNKQNQTVVRMSVPIRRKKLLTLMMEMLEHEQEEHLRERQQQQGANPPLSALPVPPPVPCTLSLSTQQKKQIAKNTTEVKRLSIALPHGAEGGRLIDSLTPKQRELFKTQNILIAEGIIIIFLFIFGSRKRDTIVLNCAVYNR